MSDNSPFKDFWQASSLSPKNIKQYATRMSGYDADSKELKLRYPDTPTRFRRRSSKLARLTKNRSSGRSFAKDLLADKDRHFILQCLSTLDGNLEHRTYPSAGASYAVETFFFDLKDNIIGYYDAEHHAFQEISKLSLNSKKLDDILNVQFQGQPSMILFFVGFPDRITPKYDERGHRFLLLEAGAMLQQVALGIAEKTHISGCAIGGLLDDQILELLKLSDENVLLLSGYIVGKKQKRR